MKQLPSKCPSCGEKLDVKRLRCSRCETEVEGLFPLPVLASLTREDQDFILEFIRLSGSLKDMAKHMNISYPTVRNRLDEIIDHLGPREEEEGKHE